MTENEKIRVALDDLRAMAEGKEYVTIVFPRGWQSPPGFPRGELLCVNSREERVRRINSARLLAWCDRTANGLQEAA